jgi:DNA-directed RNA polymerase subunit N (RpoN/RPB10)
MKINCLSCGFKIDLADAYDDYEGQVKCFACGAILEIKTQEGNVRAVKSVIPGQNSLKENVFETVNVLGVNRS